MNEIDPHGQDAHKRLDDLIRRAMRAEVDHRSLDRLERLWQREMQDPAPHRHWVPLAAAACLAIAAGILAWWNLLPHRALPQRVSQDTAPAASSHADTHAGSGAAGQPDAPAPRFAKEPNASAAHEDRALRSAGEPFSQALLAELDAESRAVRYAAARALGGLNRTDINHRLIERVVRNHRRSEALVGLAASDEQTAVQFLAQAKQHGVLSAALQAALVQAATSQPYFGG